MLISSQVLVDLAIDLNTLATRYQGISDKWLGYAGAKALVEAKIGELEKANQTPATLPAWAIELPR